MRKELLSLAIIASFLSAPCCVMAEENYNVQTPQIQYNPQEMPVQTQYPVPQQTQYSVPVNSYQSQGYGTTSYQGGYYNANQLQGNVVMVPANTSFSATTMTAISSETAKTGDSVSMYLSSDFYYGSKLIAAAGSRINGTVLLSKKGGFGSRNGQLQIKFTNIVTPYGQMIPISATIRTDDGTGILKAGTAKDVAKEYTKDAAVGAAVGAVLGTAMGALSSGSVGKGAIYGTALGGGMGLASNALQRGGNVEIPQGASVDIVTDQPITISINNPY